MRAEQPRLSLLVLTEDSAASAHDVLVALVKKMMWLIDQSYGSHLVAFKPADDASRKVMQGNLWKSRSPRDRPKIILLGRAIADRLLQEEVPGFVVFHIDGDVPWARREDSENVERFDGFVRNYVRPALDRALRAQGKQYSQPWTDEQIAATMEAAFMRLLLLVPFYSIEAWLYQNTAEARLLCAAACGRHLELIAEWDASPGLLDEIEQVKKVLPCLGADDNLALAERRFPTERAFAAGKSFAAAASRLLDCDELCAALACTRAAAWRDDG